MKMNPLLRCKTKKCIRSLLYGTLISLLFTGTLLAQELTVSGTVTSGEDGSPIPGVNVIIKGTSTGTATDLEGKYTIKVPGPETSLLFSYIGFITEEVQVGNSTVLDVVLEPDITQLSEVVVTSLGIKKEKREITYAAQNVKTKDLVEARESNVMNSLQGKVAGMDIIKSNNGPGSATRVVLRGNRSISGNNQPLYIVDGVPINNSTWSSNTNENGGWQGSDGISNINPDDIASITVLKGPNATALYGSRAANGAVIITTKQGSARKGIGVQFNSNTSMEKPLILTKFQKVYGQGSKGVYSPSGELAWGPKMEGQMVDHWSPNPNYDGPPQYPFLPHDNVKDFFVTGYNLNNNLTLTGGNDKVRGLFSYTNTISQGIVETNKLNKHNLNARVNGNLTKKFSFDAKLTYFNQHVDNRVVTGDSYFNPMRALYRQPPNISLEQAKDFEYVDQNGLLKQHYWNPGSNGGENVYWIINRTNRNEDRDRFIGLASLKYQFTDHLSLQVRSAFDKTYDVMRFTAYNNTLIVADDGLVSIDNRNLWETNNDFLLNYNNAWGANDKWTLNVSFGGNLMHQKNYWTSSRTDRLLKPNFFKVNNTSHIVANEGGSESKLNSLYATATFGFGGFLILDLTGRNDWSSTLPPENWSYFYPSVGLTWVITDMFKTTSNIISFAKIRANYAEVGGTTGAYNLSRTYSFGSGGMLGYVSRSSTLPAESLKPENTQSIELGADVDFFNGRLGINFTWYKTNTFNQLLRIPLPQASGWSYKFINAGNVQNKGVELTITATPVKAGDFQWDLAFNYAHNESLVIELTDELSEYTIRGRSWMTTYKVVEGQPYGQVFTRGFVRNDQGRILINDLGLPLTTPGQTVMMGSINPDWLGGFSNTFRYKGLSLNILMDIRMGGTIFSFTEANLTADGISEITLDGRDGFVVDGVMESDGSENTIEVTSEEYWLSLGGRNSPTGEPYGYDASFVRLREVLLGYTFTFDTPTIKSLNVSLYGRNLGFLYNASEVIDPNMSVGNSNVQGIEGFGLPSTKVYGINLGFKF